MTQEVFPINRFLSTALLCLLAPGMVSAQATGSSQTYNLHPNTVVLKSTSPAFDCPIGFSANRTAWPRMENAKDAAWSGPALGLHLMLQQNNDAAIESVDVIVHGVSTGSRLIPAAKATRDGDTSKSFELHRGNKPTLRESDLTVHNFGAITWVDLTAIHYADGTTWAANDTSKCRTEPNNLVLVGSR